MTLSQWEYDSIISDRTKVIYEDIEWEVAGNSPTRRFRIDIESDDEHPIFIDGWYNPLSGKLSYSIIHRSVGRIYGQDLGADHVNPDGVSVGEKHKNHWRPGSRGKWAYVPQDITETWNRPAAVWAQFCAEANIRHLGTIQDPVVQGSMLL